MNLIPDTIVVRIEFIAGDFSGKKKNVQNDTRRSLMGLEKGFNIPGAVNEEMKKNIIIPRYFSLERDPGAFGIRQAKGAMVIYTYIGTEEELDTTFKSLENQLRRRKEKSHLNWAGFDIYIGKRIVQVR